MLLHRHEDFDQKPFEPLRCDRLSLSFKSPLIRAKASGRCRFDRTCRLDRTGTVYIDRASTRGNSLGCQKSIVLSAPVRNMVADRQRSRTSSDNELFWCIACYSCSLYQPHLIDGQYFRSALLQHSKKVFVECREAQLEEGVVLTSSTTTSCLRSCLVAATRPGVTAVVTRNMV